MKQHRPDAPSSGHGSDAAFMCKSPKAHVAVFAGSSADARASSEFFSSPCIGLPLAASSLLKCRLVTYRFPVVKGRQDHALPPVCNPVSRPDA